MRAELGALEASAERAGAALACLYSSSDEFEAAERRARRAAWPWSQRTIATMRMVLAATAVAAAVALGSRLI